MANKKPLTKKRKAQMEKEAQRAKKKRKILHIVSIVSIVLAVLLVGGLTTWIIVANYEAPPPKYTAQIQIKDKGVVTVKLNSEKAPKTVAKFVELARNGAYDGECFFKSTEGQIFGGEERSDAVRIYGEKDNGITHSKGVISMELEMSDYVNPAEFFITVKDDASLDKTCTAFGEVTEGMDIISALTVTDDNKPIIEKITIIEK